jgi:hypothetical protein
MTLIGEAVFLSPRQVDASDVVRHVEGQLQTAVNDYDQRKFDAQSDEEVVAALVRDLHVLPLEVDWDNGTNAADEVELVSRDPFGGQGRVPGLRVSKTINYKGDQNLWTIGSGQWSSMMPRAEVRSGTIVVGMEVPANNPDQAIQHITSTIASMKEHVERQRQVLEPMNQSLPAKLLPLVQARRARRSGAQDLLNRF